MNAQEITISVDPTAAAIYLSATAEERRKLDALLSLCLSETVGEGRSLQEISRDASSEAQARGLTPAILQELLRCE